MVSDLYLHRAVSVLLGMVKRNSPTPEAVGVAKALKLAVRLREFDQMVKARGTQDTGFQSSMTISRTYWRRECEEKSQTHKHLACAESVATVQLVIIPSRQSDYNTGTADISSRKEQMMGNTFYKKITSHGSINIPRVLRTEMGLEERDPVEVVAEDNRIVVRPYNLRCIFCGTTENVKNFKNKGICGECRAHLQEEN